MAAGSESHGWILEAVDRYELPLRRYARRLLGDVDLAADAVQHAFVKLCEQSQAVLEGRVEPWLFCVCRNRALDHLRQSGREARLDDCEQPPAMGCGGTTDPARTIEQHDLAVRINALLRELPPAQRESIALWCEGFTHRRIAEITGRSEVHVRVLTHRGLSALRGHPLVQAWLAADSPAPPTHARTP